MTDTKFTPGPWHAVLNSSFWEIVPERDIGDYRKPFAIGDVCASDPSNTKGIQEPNAHLIAAAPDLYEALKAVLSSISDMGNYYDGAEDAFERARAALAKARGDHSPSG